MRILFVFFFLLSAQVAGANLLDVSSLPDDVSKNLENNASSLMTPPLTKSKMDDLIRWVYRSGGFQNVRIEEEKKDGVSVFKLIVEQTPTIEKIAIKGDTPIASSDLLESAGIEAGNNYDPYTLRNAASRALDLIRKKAYLDAKIEIEVNKGKENPNNRIVFFNIDAGKRFIIGNISVVSKNKTLKNEVLDITKDYNKEYFTSSMIDGMQNEIKDFLLDENFYNSRLEEPRYDFDNQNKIVNISFEIKGEYKYKLMFKNNKSISTLSLLNKLNFKKGDPLGINPGADITERLKEIYKNRGFANIDITYEASTNETKLVKEITFNIEEGNKIKIGSYNIDGNSSISKDKYIDLIKDFSGDLIDSGVYHEKQLDNGLENLVAHLQNQGYLKARILSHRVTYNQDRDEVEVYIRVDEGPRSYLTKIVFHGAKAFKKDKLLNILNLTEGAPLQLKKVEDAIEKLKQFYKERGYLDIEIDNKNENFISYYDENKKADLNFYLSEGDQIQVSRIEISGTSQTKNRVIRNALDFKVGDVLTSERIKESESNLRRLGIFNSVSIQHKSGTQPQRVVRVVISERKPGTLTFGVGVSNELGLTARGYTGVAYRNLFGTARAVQGRVQLSSNINANDFVDYKVNASYLEPFMFDTKTKGKVNVLTSQSLTSTSTTDLEAAESTAIEFILEKDITRFLKLTWQLWGIERNKIFEVEDENIQEERNIAELGPTIELDYRDNPFVPKEGTYTRLSIDYSSPNIGSTESDGPDSDANTVHFIRSTMLFNQYLPFFNSKDIIFAYSVRGGYLKNLGEEGTSAVPKERLFFLGGINTIRGFATNSIPNEEALVQDGDEFASVSTESYYYLAKLEIRVPIMKNFGTALFYDGGGVQVQGKDLGDTYRNSIGLSLQYLTPIGAINLGYGYKLDRNFESNESEGEIFFSIGDF